MLTHSQHPDEKMHKLILLSSDGSRVFLNRENPVHLPKVTVRGRIKFAQELTNAIRKNWNLETVHLLRFDAAPIVQDEDPYQVLEVLDTGESKSLEPVAIENLSSVGISSEKQKLIRSAVEICKRYNPELPFTRLGWITELRDWLRKELPALGIKKPESLTHVKGSGKSVLVRFQTEIGSLWFKTPPPRIYREFEITLLLAKLCPGQIPAILATKPDWHGWLMKECGISLHEIPPQQHPYKTIVEALAILQIGTGAAANQFISLGCRDTSIAVMRKQVPALMKVLRHAMHLQTSQVSRPLQDQEIDLLGNQLLAACDYLAQFPIPDTVLHGDLTDGSIVADGDRVAFVDWEQTYVGNPLFNFQYLCAYAKTHHLEIAASLIALRLDYLKSLEQHWNLVDLEDAFRVVPLLTILAEICGTSSWFDPGFVTDPDGGKYLRSRARLMYREIQQPEFQEALCLAR